MSEGTFDPADAVMEVKVGEVSARDCAVPFTRMRETNSAHTKSETVSEGEEKEPPLKRMSGVDRVVPSFSDGLIAIEVRVSVPAETEKSVHVKGVTVDVKVMDEMDATAPLNEKRKGLSSENQKMHRIYHSLLPG